jgi:hypothetical protein
MSRILRATVTGVNSALTQGTTLTVVNLFVPAVGAGIAMTWVLLKNKHKTDDDWWKYPAIGAASGLAFQMSCRVWSQVKTAII